MKNRAKIAKSMMTMLRVKYLVRKGVDSKKSRGKLSTKTKGRQYDDCKKGSTLKLAQSKLKKTLI